MKRQQIVKCLMLIAIALVAATACGDLTLPPRYHGERLSQMPIVRVAEMPLGFILLMVIFACVAGALIDMFLCRRFKSARTRTIGRLLVVGVLGMGLMSIVFALKSPIEPVSDEADSAFKCEKCGSTFKASELTGREDASYFEHSTSGQGHYKYDCPKCSGWHWERRRPPRFESETFSN